MQEPTPKQVQAVAKKLRRVVGYNHRMPLEQFEGITASDMLIAITEGFLEPNTGRKYWYEVNFSMIVDACEDVPSDELTIVSSKELEGNEHLCIVAFKGDEYRIHCDASRDSIYSITRLDNLSQRLQFVETDYDKAKYLYTLEGGYVHDSFNVPNYPYSYHDYKGYWDKEGLELLVINYLKRLAKAKAKKEGIKDSE